MAPLLFLGILVLFSSLIICVKMSDNVSVYDHSEYVINITDHNDTRENLASGRKSDADPVHQFSDLDFITSKEHLNLFQTSHPHGLYASRKGKPSKEFKYLLPIIIQAITKLAHLLPIAKLTLLTLFALVLFAKKAFLISAASFAYVMYDSFYKGKKPKVTIKDRGAEPYHTYDHSYDHSYGSYYPEVYQDHGAPSQHLWSKVESHMPKISRVYPRESEETEDEVNWKRWWNPLNKNHKIDHFEETDMGSWDNDLYKSYYQSK